MQNQLVCCGCRTLLLYPRGAPNVRCSLCNVVTPAPPTGVEMAQLVCGGCRTLLMYTRGATSVRCSCCHTVNIVPVTRSSHVAQVNCGHCRTMLLYPYGAPSVQCAICHYITNVSMGNATVPISMQGADGASATTAVSAASSSTSSNQMPTSSQTVVVQHPMSVDESGKLVNNVAVAVATQSK